MPVQPSNPKNPGRRISRVPDLCQKIWAAKSPDEVLHAWSLFRVEAVADCGELADGFVKDRISSGIDSDARPRPQQAKAA